MLKLGDFRIGVAVVNELVQILDRFPDAHAAPVEQEELLLFRADEFERLAHVIEPVKLPDGRPSLRPIIAKDLTFAMGPVRSFARAVRVALL